VALSKITETSQVQRFPSNEACNKTMEVTLKVLDYVFHNRSSNGKSALHSRIDILKTTD
jgi:hypothetical protein